MMVCVVDLQHLQGETCAMGYSSVNVAYAPCVCMHACVHACMCACVWVRACCARGENVSVREYVHSSLSSHPPVLVRFLPYPSYCSPPLLPALCTFCPQRPGWRRSHSNVQDFFGWLLAEARQKAGRPVTDQRSAAGKMSQNTRFLTHAHAHTSNVVDGVILELYVNMHVYTHAQTCVYARVYGVCVHICVPVCMFKCIHISLCVCVCVRERECVYTCIYTYTYIYIYIHIYIYICR